MRIWRLAPVVALLGCQGVSPLTNQIAVGEEPFLVLVATGRDNQVDLFAGSPGGGVVTRLTFTRDRESSPAVHPAGTAVAFLRRAPSPTDSTTWLVVMNLVNAAEREAEVPAEIGAARRVGWSHDGSRLYVSGTYGFAVSPAPPAALAPVSLAPGDPGIPAADSATSVLLGSPPIARIESCAIDCITSVAQRVCAVTRAGERQDLGAGVRWPFRWGADSMGYFEGGQLMVRPLAGGKARRIAWTGVPENPGDASYWMVSGEP
jgi:hypothetical protein